MITILSNMTTFLLYRDYLQDIITKTSLTCSPLLSMVWNLKLRKSSTQLSHL